MAEHKGPFWGIYEELKSGKITRRDFIQKASALGVGLPVTMFVLNAVGGGSAAAQAATGAAGHRHRGPAARRRRRAEASPVAGADPRQSAHVHRAPRTPSRPRSSPSRCCTSCPTASLIPNLVKEVPSVDNGLLSADFTSVTYNLLEGVLWSDGQPFTSADVQFTWQWIIDPANQSINR